ncbi:hypothetical protein HDE_00951 [Halotydeus destructor]|nr:hypothetical protein HDE_00951 [Halotydeus destructor]
MHRHNQSSSYLNDDGGQCTCCMFFSYVIAIGVILASAYVVVYEKMVNLSHVQPSDLDTFGAKLEFTVKYWSLHTGFMALIVIDVMKTRCMRRVVNPLSGFEEDVQSPKNVLTNSIEQFVLSVAAQLALLHYVTPELVVQIIPLMNTLWFFGRVTFYLGYPERRAFGFALTFFPTLGAICYSIYGFTCEQYLLFPIGQFKS